MNPTGHLRETRRVQHGNGFLLHAGAQTALLRALQGKRIANFGRDSPPRRPLLAPRLRGGLFVLIRTSSARGAYLTSGM